MLNTFNIIVLYYKCIILILDCI